MLDGLFEQTYYKETLVNKTEYPSSLTPPAANTIFIAMLKNPKKLHAWGSKGPLETILVKSDS